MLLIFLKRMLNVQVDMLQGNPCNKESTCTSTSNRPLSVQSIKENLVNKLCLKYQFLILF